jgi:hypothetical protein
MQEEEEEEDEDTNKYKIFSKTQKQHTQIEGMLQRLAGWLLSLLVPVGVGWLLCLPCFALHCFCSVLAFSNNKTTTTATTTTTTTKDSNSCQMGCGKKTTSLHIFPLVFFLFPSLSLSLSLSRNYCCCWLATIASFFLTR